MNRQEILQTIEKSGVIAVIRLKEKKNFDRIIESLAEGGITAIEITMTTPNAVELIGEYSKKYSGKFLFGAGTVLNTETATRVIDAGAEFVVGPVLNLDLIKKHMSLINLFFPALILQQKYTLRGKMVRMW